MHPFLVATQERTQLEPRPGTPTELDRPGAEHTQRPRFGFLAGADVVERSGLPSVLLRCPRGGGGVVSFKLRGVMMSRSTSSQVPSVCGESQVDFF